MNNRKSRGGIIASQPFAVSAYGARNDAMMMGGNTAATPAAPNYSKTVQLADTGIGIRVSNWNKVPYVHITKSGRQKSYYLPLQETEFEDFIANAQNIASMIKECKKHIKAVYGSVGVTLANGGEKIDILPKSKAASKLEKAALKKAKQLEAVYKQTLATNSDDEDSSSSGIDDDSADDADDRGYESASSSDAESAQEEEIRVQQRAKKRALVQKKPLKVKKNKCSAASKNSAVSAAHIAHE